MELEAIVQYDHDGEDTDDIEINSNHKKLHLAKLLPHLTVGGLLKPSPGLKKNIINVFLNIDSI